MPKKLTNEEFLIKLHEKYPTIDTNDIYSGSGVEMRFYNTETGEEWVRTPTNAFRYGFNTKKDISKNRKNKNYIPFLEELHKNFKNVDVVSEWNGYKNKITCHCNIHDYNWTVLPTTVKEKGCPLCCGSVTRKWSDEEYKHKLKEISNDNLSCLDTYKNMNTKILHKCQKHNYEFLIKPSKVMRGQGCYYCGLEKIGDLKRKTPEQFNEEVKELVGDEYSVDSDYTVSGEKVLFTHFIDEKSHQFEMSPNAFLCGQRCPICYMPSRLEEKVKRFLKNNDIEYEPQKKYKGLVGNSGGMLSYDFYLPKYNLLIECQGRQHEEPIDHFGGEERFKVQQEHDKRKRNYAKKHNIDLLEIWHYEEENAQEILVNYLKLNNDETLEEKVG